MKRIISLIMSFVLIILPLSVISFAEEENTVFGGIDISQYADEELDLTQYTMDDLQHMTPAEYEQLLRDFARVYDPSNPYAEGDELEMMSGIQPGNIANPDWKAGKVNGDGEWTEVGTHEFITMTACQILTNDKGFFTNNAPAALIISLSISLASLKPDKDEKESSFEGHFYDPNTGKSHTGSTTNTAKTNASSHFQAAVTAANNGDMTEAYEQLGRCIHYIQDVNQPHHAANMIAVLYPHITFESYANQNRVAFLENYTSISADYYTYATSKTILAITHNAASKAYPKASLIADALDHSQWEAVAKYGLKKASQYSAMVMYKFGQVASVPFVTT